MASSWRKLPACCTFGLAAIAAFPLSAGDMATAVPTKRAAAAAMVLPGTSYAVHLGRFPPRLRPVQPEPALLEAVAAWLASELGLSPMDDPPAIVFASARRMVSLRLRGMSLDGRGGGPAEILAAYDDEARTVYLPERWSGGTAAELSVLVHEMVHHLQNSAAARFECPEAREKMAYEAQARWLAMFGSGLAADFGIDPMTLLVRTSCFR